MSSCLKIGNRLFNSDRLLSCLVQYKLLDTLVGQVVLDEALKDITLTKEEIFSSLVGVMDTEAPEDFENFLSQWCLHRQVSLEYFKAVVLRELHIEKFKQDRFANQLESEFLQMKPELDQVDYSRIQLNNLALAQELYFQLRDDGADFGQLAKQHSISRDRETGGLLGPVTLASLPDEIRDLFRNPELGVIYGPVPVGNEFWIVRLEQYYTARLTATTRTILIDRLFNRWLQNQTRAVMDIPGTIAVQSTPAEPVPAALSN